MSKSIVSNIRRCFVCETTLSLEKHHIFFNRANRKLSEKYGCWVYLCAIHHRDSKQGVHFNREFDQNLKKACQGMFEKTVGSREEFMEIFGKNWL